MASIRLPSFVSHGSNGGRPRNTGGKKTVKPILKKWSHSEKNSLDLDRAWDDQEDLHWRSDSAFSQPVAPFYESRPASRSLKDVGNIAFQDVINNSAGAATGNRYAHSRSLSATSHVSAATSNSSGAPRGFVHPFQQTPLGSLPDRHSIDHSPGTITEDDDDGGDRLTSEPTSFASYSNLQQPTTPYSISQPSLSGSGRSTAASTYRSPSSYTDASSLRMTTSRSPSTALNSSSRLASQSAPQHDRVPNSPSSSPKVTTATSPSASAIALQKSGAFQPLPPPPAPSAMSPLRSSFDSSFPRLRAKSDLDTGTRADQLREARRKFDQRERAKDEKYAREEVRRRERADKKRAQAAIKEQKHHQDSMDGNDDSYDCIGGKKHHRRKMSATSTIGRPSLSSRRPSLAASRRDTGKSSASQARLGGTFEDSQRTGMDQLFISNNYDAVESQKPPTLEEQYEPHPHTKKRTTGHSTKYRTQGTWTTFILWLRTKILRVSRTR